MLSILFQSFGGLGLFLFGMKIMSEGLQKVAGKKMRRVLGLVSNNRFVGCGVGALVTSVIQSSSATTVMLVSFVDAGLMTFKQAVGVVLGANIGTTITAQLIAFNITAYALPAVAVGVFLKFFLGHRRWVYIGDILLGFGLVFYGLATMKAGFAPLKESASFVSFITRFQADSLCGVTLSVIAGTIFTMILQSSSATVGVTMALAMQGLLTFETSVALILGDNIGTTITAELSSIGSNINAHRTARAHTLFNVIGVFMIILFFPIFLTLVSFVTHTVMQFGPPDLVIQGERPNVARYIANAHTFFNVINAAIFLMAIPILMKIATWLTPGKEEKPELDELHHVRYMDVKFVETPAVALTQARAEVYRMGEAVQVMFADVIHSLRERKVKELSKWRKREYALDVLQKEITQFLVRVTQEVISPEESREVRSLIRMTNNLERVGDAVEDVAEMIEKLFERNLTLSEEAMKDYEDISSEVSRFLSLVVDAIRHDHEELMAKARTSEDMINHMEEQMKGNHLTRLQRGVCSIDPGIIFVNILTAFEKMGGFCFNIAQAVAGLR
ncbi:MAG: Na/Pi cotransporter family protein [Deltaproteobacteria bacterium]|nr:Na/Pi cotransporter family protein [Deltaproteobacteria bacterium]